MLPRAGLGDDALLAHAHSKKRLAQAVVDLVRAGVEQVFALEINLRATQSLCEPRRKIERRRTAGVVAQQRVELQMEVGVGLGLGVRTLQFVERSDQGLGDISSAIKAEASGDCGCAGCHRFRVQGPGCRVQGCYLGEPVVSLSALLMKSMQSDAASCVKTLPRLFSWEIMTPPPY